MHTVACLKILAWVKLSRALASILYWNQRPLLRFQTRKKDYQFVQIGNRQITRGHWLNDRIAQQACTCIGRSSSVFVLAFEIRSPACSKRLIECRQGNWFEINLSVSHVQPRYSQFRNNLLTRSHHRSHNNVNASTFRINAKISLLAKCVVCTRWKAATVNCIFAKNSKIDLACRTRQTAYYSHIKRDQITEQHRAHTQTHLKKSF